MGFIPELLPLEGFDLPVEDCFIGFGWHYCDLGACFGRREDSLVFFGAALLIYEHRWDVNLLHCLSDSCSPDIDSQYHFCFISVRYLAAFPSFPIGLVVCKRDFLFPHPLSLSSLHFYLFHCSPFPNRRFRITCSNYISSIHQFTTFPSVVCRLACCSLESPVALSQCYGITHLLLPHSKATCQITVNSRVCPKTKRLSYQYKTFC